MTLGRWILFLNGAPYSVTVGYLYVGIAMLIGIAHKPRFEPGFVLTAQWRPWFDKMWRYSTTLGRGIIYSVRARDDDPTLVDSRLERHERKHVWQVDDLMAVSAMVGLAVYLSTGEGQTAWFIYQSGGLWLLPNFLTAVLRHGPAPETDAAGNRRGLWARYAETAYRDAEHERSAYAQTDLCIHLGQSWDELRELGK